MNKIFVALDTETTGLRAANDAIIEIAAVKFRGDQVMDTWTSLVNPGRELPLKVERLTGRKPRFYRSGTVVYCRRASAANARISS